MSKSIGVSGTLVARAGLWTGPPGPALRIGRDRPDLWLSFAKHAYQEQSRRSVREGAARPKELRLIPRALLRKAKVRFPDVDYDD